MQVKKEWYKTDTVGQLFLDIVFIESAFPILLACCDKTYDNKYLVETLDPMDGRYLIVPVTTADILNMLENRVSLEQTFRRQNTAYLSCFDDDYNLCLTQIEGSEILAEDLPEPEVYFEFSNQKIQEYIKTLENELSDRVYSITVAYENNPNLKVLENDLQEFYQPKLTGTDNDSYLNYFEKYDSVNIADAIFVNTLTDDKKLEINTLQRAA